MKIERVWAMPSRDTFSVPPIRDFVRRYLAQSRVSIDPLARNSHLATYTNDLNPNTLATYHMDAELFCRVLRWKGIRADLGIVDPPYSPRQVKECYEGVGLSVGTKETQMAALYARVRDVLDPLIEVGGVVLSFGWNSSGMGIGRGYIQEEMLIVCHGAAHNDTICLAERKLKGVPHHDGNGAAVGYQDNNRGFASFEIIDARENEHACLITARFKPQPSDCPRCGGPSYYRHGVRSQVIKDTPLYGKRLSVKVLRQRYKCRGCGKTFMQDISAVIDERRCMTRRLKRYIAHRGHAQTFRSIAREVGVDEKTIRNISSE